MVASNQIVDNNDLPDFNVTSTEMPDGSQLQHVKLIGNLSGSTPAPDTGTVTDSSSEILAANTDRKGAIVVNDSSLDVYLSFGSNPAVVGSGIRLNSEGGVFTMDAFTFTTEAINAIAASGSNNMTVQEFE